ncbi:MAG: response regulator [Candidatus Gracilibacteria bacterium]|nr:response regulator [Candidatus Gracilibacteria bacterium]
MDQKRILIIEDELDLLQLYKIALQNAGYRVHTSTNGFDGVQKAFEKNPDLILLDLMMQKGDGQDVLSTIRLHDIGKEIPIIIISNLNPGTIDLSKRDDQILDYWVKADLTPRSLVSRLKEYFA